jgi:hypothetical protein
MRAWLLTLGLLACAACGGRPRSTAGDLLAMHQPTPDPTLDAVVRDLPRALAGIPPTPTPTAVPPKPSARTATSAATPKPKPTATPVPRR